MEASQKSRFIIRIMGFNYLLDKRYNINSENIETAKEIGRIIKRKKFKKTPCCLWVSPENPPLTTDLTSVTSLPSRNQNKTVHI